MPKPLQTFDFPAEDAEAKYTARGCDHLSDAQLVRHVAGLISIPRQDPGGSFVLHAPLELAARAALLPMVAPHKMGDLVSARVLPGKPGTSHASRTGRDYNIARAPKLTPTCPPPAQ